jgi:hypothetical protein
MHDSDVYQHKSLSMSNLHTKTASWQSTLIKANQGKSSYYFEPSCPPFHPEKSGSSEDFAPNSTGLAYKRDHAA